MQNQLSFIPLGGIGDVTRNMYVYEYNNEVLIVDCGLGFADETMLGVDLLLPDISYLLQAKKRIVGMLLTHGHEDHIGALPFLLPQLYSVNKQPFPVFGTPFTAVLANEKLKEFGSKPWVKSVTFDRGQVSLGSFRASFIHVTHSVPDTSHIFLETPVGNIYHGSDFKFDDTPVFGEKSDYDQIAALSSKGVLCLLSDCLGSERKGRVATEIGLMEGFERELRACNGKFIVTTFSSNIGRINQIIAASEKVGRKVVFIGRSLIKAKEVAAKIGYLQMKSVSEVALDQIKNYPDKALTLIIAGSQGQENSAMARIANREHREVKLSQGDTVIFSSDPIPGNEVMINELVDTIAKNGSRVLYSGVTKEFHVSGHGSLDELSQLISLVKPKNLIPIGGNFRHMVAYQNLAESLGYKRSNILLLEDGKEVLLSQNMIKLGRTVPVKNVYVDEISGEEIESMVLRDRQKLSEGGIVIILCQVDSANGQLLGKPEVIARGFPPDDSKRLEVKLTPEIRRALLRRKGRVTNWVYIRNLVGEISERRIFKDLKRRPLVLPVVIEV